MQPPFETALTTSKHTNNNAHTSILSSIETNSMNSSCSCRALIFALVIYSFNFVESFIFPQLAIKGIIATSTVSTASTQSQQTSCVEKEQNIAVVSNNKNKNNCVQQVRNQKSTTTTSLYSTSSTSNDPMSQAALPRWYQKQISITAPSRGCHLITSDVLKAIQTDLSTINIGMANLFIQHTSASLTINENADPDVRRDMEVALNKIVPGSWTRDGTFHHTMEGEDDMPGHVKTTLIGPSLNIPIRNGRLALGTWQGIYLNEHRDQGGWGGGHSRNIIITLQGQG